MKHVINTVRPVGPYIIDRAHVAVGEYITLSADYSPDCFEPGDRLKVIGYELCDEELDKEYMHRGLYFAPGTYKQVCYQIALFSRATGEQTDRAVIFPNECEFHRWNDSFDSKVCSRARILKPAIDVLYKAGLENAARVLERYRLEALQRLLRQRRDTLKAREVRDRQHSFRVLARMGQDKAVAFVIQGQESRRATVASSSETAVTLSLNGMLHLFTYTQLLRFEILAEVQNEAV